MATFDPTGSEEMLKALRNANDGYAITIWTDSPDGKAGWKLWRTLDAKYAEGDLGWLMTIPIHHIADELVKADHKP